MQSKANPKPTVSEEVVVIAPDIVRVAPGDKEPADPARDIKARTAEPQGRTEAGTAANSSVPPVDTTFRAAAVNPAKGEARSFGRRFMRVMRSFLIAMFLAAGSGVIAYGWENYGDNAKEILADRLPQLLPTSFSLPSFPSLSRLFPPLPSPSQETSTPAEQPSQQAAPAVASNAVAAQPEPPAPGPEGAAAPVQAAEAAAPVAALSPDSAQLLQSMAHDLATVSQDIAQLRASVEQLKASQEQMARELAKAREQNARPKVAVAVPPIRPAALSMPMPARRPTASYPSQAAMPASPSRTGSLPAAQAALPPPRSGMPAGAQAASPPALPYAAAPPLSLQPEPQANADDEDAPVVRPPMPVR